MASYYQSFNPFVASPDFDAKYENVFNVPVDPSANQTDWWEFSADKDTNNAGYTRRLGETVAQALAKSGYYTTSRDYESLGSNIADVANIAKLKAAAAGNINAATNSDTVRQYLKEHLKQYLTSGNLGQATGIAGPGNAAAGTGVGDLYGQIAANAAAAQTANDAGLAKNWYAANGFPILQGLGTVAGLQQGGGLRSSTNEMLANIEARRRSQPGGVFWQDAGGATVNPWGGQFAPNLTFTTPTTTTPATGGAGGGGEGGAGAVVPPIVPPVVPPQTGPGAGAETPPSTTVPNTPVPGVGAGDVYHAPTMPSAPIDTTYPSLDFNQTIDQLWPELFGRPPTGSERSQWADRLATNYGGDLAAMTQALRTSTPAQQYAATHVAAPVVANATDRQGAQSFFDWLRPGGDPEQWITNYLTDLGRVSRA